MERNLIKDLKLDEQNLLYGFVENIRNKKTMAFIVLRDVSGKVQVTVEKGKNAELDNIVDQITLESVISVSLLQLRKAPLLISTTLSDIVAPCKLLHEQNPSMPVYKIFCRLNIRLFK